MNSASSSPTASAPERVFGWREHTALWFSLGVGLLVMQVGAYLVPAMGTQGALLAVVFGSLLGAGLLAWVAWLGCTSGQTSGVCQSIRPRPMTEGGAIRMKTLARMRAGHGPKRCRRCASSHKTTGQSTAPTAH